jgi:flavin-binding protein dodecin
MDDTQHHRRYGVVGLLVMVALATAIVVFAVHRSGPAPTEFVDGAVSGQLRDATVDLIGHPPDGAGSLDDALALARRSVDDMAVLDDAAFVETYERSASQQAEVVGRWLGLASRELGGGDLGRVTRTTLDLVGRAPAGVRDDLQKALDRASDGP